MKYYIFGAAIANLTFQFFLTLKSSILNND